MKRFMAILLSVLLLCSVCCRAETSTAKEKAQELISMVNYFVRNNKGIEQLFTGYQEVEAGQAYGFGTDDTDLRALLLVDEESGEIDSCSFITDTLENIYLALDCCCTIPFKAMFDAEDAETEAAIQADVVTMAAMIDENSSDIIEAFIHGEPYFFNYQDSEFFHMEMTIVPLTEGSRMMASFYFGPAQLES